MLFIMLILLNKTECDWSYVNYWGRKNCAGKCILLVWVSLDRELEARKPVAVRIYIYIYCNCVAIIICNFIYQLWHANKNCISWNYKIVLSS